MSAALGQPVVVPGLLAGYTGRWIAETLAAQGVRNIDQYNRNLRAAIAEQAANNRLIRPSALYVGPQPPRPLPDGYGAALTSAELAR